jgi:hypothetical protein
MRYVDDKRLFSDSKQEIHAWKQAVINHLSAGLRLTIHATSAQPRRCISGVPFLGFQVFCDHRRLKRSKVVNARRKLKNLSPAYCQDEIDFARLQAEILGWINHARSGDPGVCAARCWLI